jgi:hypothetical protein
VPDLVVPRDVRRVHRQAQAAMLSVEAASRRAMAATVADVAKRNAGRAGDLPGASGALRARLAPILLETRRAARVAASRALAKELAVSAKVAADYGVALPVTAEVASFIKGDDSEQATNLAADYADAFIAKAHEGRATGVTLSDVVRALTYRVDRLAATETSQAFNGQRATVERAYRDRYAGTQWFPAMVKVWDATLDRHVCRVCAGKAGQVRPWGFSWNGLEPGQPHVNCRCTGMMLFAPIYMGREFTEDEAA